MKATIITIITTLAWFTGPAVVTAQPDLHTTIQYEVPFGPVYPIWASSNLIQGSLALNDSTAAVEKLDFSVPLNSFIGQNANYLEWLGYSFTFPNLEFRTNKVINQGDGKYQVKGNLQFRGQFEPVTINYKREDTEDWITFNGSFTFNPRDFFISAPPFDLVPNRIPMTLNLVFSKADIQSATAANGK
ncbi:MAG TPA: YceI family protein [Saprospiraceae bacterium]|nr:YceI family protein [Saprospiraceae bacterium]HPG09712.1 YceI family protein [Saprospiraceae bacterium]HPQ99773.1 YceI family protein [Saprospiraceae bacterium]HRV87175.1 YceI family protein [Saprospiraceae bacterium]